MLFLLLGLVCSVAWAQTATIQVSTNVTTPEHLFEIKSSADHWMTSFTSPSDKIRGCFAFFDDNDGTTEDAYKIFSVTHNKWVSYTKSDSYTGGKNKAILVDTQEQANAWNATIGSNNYYVIAPYQNDDNVSSFCWNWHGGTGGNPYNNVEYTVGLHNNKEDGGSLWVLSEVTETATADDVTSAIETLKGENFGKVGYPKTNTPLLRLYDLMVGVVSTTTLNNIELAYKTCSDIVLPEDGKAYKIENYSLSTVATTRYLNYTAGRALSVSTEESDASVFLCHELSAGVYVLITEDGKVLTWPHSGEGFEENSNRYGYSNNYGTVYSNYSDWNKITIKKNGTYEKDFGHLRLVARRYARDNNPNSSFIVKGSNGSWDRAGDSYYLDEVGPNWYSSAWIFTEVAHTKNQAQNLALAKIDAKVDVASKAGNLGEALGYYSYTINETKVYTSTNVNAAIDEAESVDEVNAIKNSYAVNLPETRKYYRIKGISGNYLDAVNCYSGDQMGLKSKEEYSPTGTIFYLDNENRLRNFATGTYIYGTRHIGTTNTAEKNAWTFAASTRTLGYLTLTSNSSDSKELHDNSGNRADRCGSICGNRHDWIIEEVSELPRHGKTYYIYIDTYQNSAFVNRFFYVNSNNALNMNTALEEDAAYKWTCTVTSEGYVQFQNGNGKYLSHKGVSDSSYNFEIRKGNTYHGVVASLYSVAADRYFVVNNDGTGFNQADRIYNQKTENYCTDFVFLPTDEVHILTVEGPSLAKASATWNNELKPLPASWILTPNTTITSPTLSISFKPGHEFNGLYEGETYLGESIEINSMTESRTITSKFTPAFFSQNYGEKWVRINNCSNNSNWATIESTANNGKGKTAPLDYTDEKQMWCLVGTAENFVLYNKAVGENMALNVPLTEQNEATVSGDQALLSEEKGSWKLKEQDFGYAIVPTQNTNTSDLGINMWGGSGGYLKVFATGANNLGSYWTVQLVDTENPLRLSVEVDKVWESSPRVAEMTFAVDGTSSQTRIEGNVDAQTYYLPEEATFSLSSMTYRGYTFNGFGDEYTNATIPDGGLEINASYTANEERTLFYSPRDGHPYRIPAIATAPNGDIFAICDYRPCGRDIGYGEVDLVCRVSSDNGATWTEERTIADGLGHIDDGIWKMGFGDPAIVADRESNKVLVMSVCGNRTCWDGNYGEENANPNRVSRLYITYDDTEKEWVYGDPEEVTDDIYPKFVDSDDNVHAASLFIGAGKICQSRVVKKGEYYRLYCAVWNVTMTQRQHHNYVIYSDDFGETWNVLGDLGYSNSPAPAGNEPKCEELPDGTVVLSSRVSGGRFFNLFTFTDNTYTSGSWGTVAKSTETYDGSSQGTNGEIYKVKAIRKADGKICDVMLQSVPAGPGRSNVKVYYKEMEYNANGTNKYTPETFATGWAVGKQVSQKESCYSTMILQADGRIGFFFEEVPGGYCMVYIPYTLDELTDNKYSLYTVNSTIGEYKVGTFYATEAMQIPEGVKAYVATETPETDGENGRIHMTRLEGIIPANTGAVLRAESADTYTFVPSISYGTPVDGNMLVGYEAADNDAESYNEFDDVPTGSYVLTVKNEKAAFYRWETSDADRKFRVYNNKAYLQVPAAGNARAIYFSFDGEDATGIIETESDNVKAQIYDLSGRRVQNVQKGIYIVNGNKVLK